MTEIETKWQNDRDRDRDRDRDSDRDRDRDSSVPKRLCAVCGMFGMLMLTCSPDMCDCGVH